MVCGPAQAGVSGPGSSSGYTSLTTALSASDSSPEGTACPPVSPPSSRDLDLGARLDLRLRVADEAERDAAHDRVEVQRPHPLLGLREPLGHQLVDPPRDQV